MPDENMGCGCGCQDCECKEVNVCEPTEKVDANLRDKLMVFKDYVCTIALTPCSQLGKVMSKVVYYLWCMLKDLVNMAINNRKRTETLMENDEYFCGRMSAVSTWTNLVQQITDRNNQKLVQFSREMSQLGLDSKKIGHLERPLAQALIFDNEPDAIISKVTGADKVANKSALDSFASSLNPINVSAVWNVGNVYFLEKDKPATVTYENLKNSSVNGVKISKVDYIYTLKKSTIGNGSKVAAGLYNDPTKTINILDGDGATVKVELRFYDEAGNIISPVGSVISFASLNTNTYGNDYEGVSGASGIDFVKINGSSIDVIGGVAKAKNSNAAKSAGSQYDASEWDSFDSPLEYYGAIAGEVTADNFSFNIETKRRGNTGFSVNSQVKAKVVRKPALEQIPVFKHECNIKGFEC